MGVRQATGNAQSLIPGLAAVLELCGDTSGDIAQMAMLDNPRGARGENVDPGIRKMALAMLHNALDDARMQADVVDDLGGFRQANAKWWFETPDADMEWGLAACCDILGVEVILVQKLARRLYASGSAGRFRLRADAVGDRRGRA